MAMLGCCGALVSTVGAAVSMPLVLPAGSVAVTRILGVDVSLNPSPQIPLIGVAVAVSTL
jgi:hypothetical protein